MDLVHADRPTATLKACKGEYDDSNSNNVIRIATIIVTVIIIVIKKQLSIATLSLCLAFAE